jgi:hypothetical protein
MGSPAASVLGDQGLLLVGEAQKPAECDPEVVDGTQTTLGFNCCIQCLVVAQPNILGLSMTSQKQDISSGKIPSFSHTSRPASPLNRRAPATPQGDCKQSNLYKRLYIGTQTH